MAFEHIYRPQHKSDTEIVNDFVVRNAMFERLMADIRKDGPGKLSQHHMVQGLRGMGKSTLFERIRVEMKQPDLTQRWLTVKTAEENWPVNSLLDFWIWIGQHMAAVDPSGFGALGDLGSLWNKDEEHEHCFTTIEARLKGAGKKLLMLVDNVGDLFRKFNKHENQALRELLVSNKHIKLIGGTAVRLDELETHDAPYFDLFKEHHLAGLNQQEVIAMLKHYAHKNGRKHVEEVIRKEPRRVDHLRILTGGVPRTIMMLLDVFNTDGDASVFDDLRRTLDLVTPLYKHRMDELSPQKQKIVHALAMNWDGMSAGEIATATRLESKVVSAQLGQLVREGSVLREETSTKNHFYQLAERFFNIWYLMNNAHRNGAAKVRWLTRFFELWCDERGLQERALKHEGSLGHHDVNPADHVLITNALLGSEGLDVGMKQRLFERTMQAFPNHTDQILAENHWRTREPKPDWRAAVWNAIERFDLDLAERLLRLNGDEADPWTSTFRGDVAVLKGDLTTARRAFEDGLRIRKTLTEKDPSNARAQRELSISYDDLGDLLVSEGELPQARRAVEDGLRIRKTLAEKDPSNAQAQRDLSISYERLGVLLFREGELPQARRAFEDGLRIRKTLAKKDSSNARAQRDLAIAHWLLQGAAKEDKVFAKAQQDAYTRLADAMAQETIDAWKLGALEDAFSRTIQLIRLPMSTARILETLLWGLARQQYHGFRELFEVRFPYLKTEYRPVYFALLRLMKDVDPDSHRRMGKELEEPVQALLKRVEEMRKELDTPKTKKPRNPRRPKPTKTATRKR